MTPNLQQCTEASKTAWLVNALYDQRSTHEKTESHTRNKHPMQNSTCSCDTPWRMCRLSRVLLWQHIYCVYIRHVCVPRHQTLCTSFTILTRVRTVLSLTTNTKHSTARNACPMTFPPAGGLTSERPAERPSSGITMAEFWNVKLERNNDTTEILFLYFECCKMSIEAQKSKLKKKKKTDICSRNVTRCLQARGANFNTGFF